MSLPALDTFFRNRITGGLKKEFTFIVHNGPAEQPSSPLVQMCMAHLNFLKLEKVILVSFAEYHSKRNFVERVHAQENRVLSKHGPFKSDSVYPHATTGSNEHRQNMEHMATEVFQCINWASFGGKSLLCYRGIKDSEFLFDDEQALHTFMTLTEEKSLTVLVQHTELEKTTFWMNSKWYGTLTLTLKAITSQTTKFCKTNLPMAGHHGQTNTLLQYTLLPPTLPPQEINYNLYQIT